MIPLLLSSILLLSVVSLASYFYCLQDIRDGKPHILSLRQITGIMDRDRLNALFGHPDAKYHYSLTPAMQQAIWRHRFSFLIRECAAEAVCALGAWRFLSSPAELPALYGFLLLAVICQGIEIMRTFVLVRRWWPQISGELDDQ